MDYQEIIKQLLALEEYLEEGRKKAHEIRMQIESTDTPAPLQEDISEEAKLAKLLGKKENGKSSNKKVPLKKLSDEGL